MDNLTPPNNQPQLQTEIPNKKYKLWIWITMIIILLLISIGIYLLISNSSKEQIKDNSPDTENESKETSLENQQQETTLEEKNEKCKNSCNGFCSEIGESYNGQSGVSSTSPEECSCNCGDAGWTDFILNTGEISEIESTAERCLHSCDDSCATIGEPHTGSVGGVSGENNEYCGCFCGGEGFTRFNAETGEREVKEEEETSTNSEVDNLYIDYLKCIDSCPESDCKHPNYPFKGTINCGGEELNPFSKCIDYDCKDDCGYELSEKLGGEFKKPSGEIWGAVLCPTALGDGKDCVAFANFPGEEGVGTSCEEILKYGCANFCWEDLI
jgi:hypothetical protein